MERIEDVEEISLAGKIKNSLVGALIGLVLFVSAIIILWMNEADYANNIELAKFVKANVINVNSANISKLNNGKLIHTSDYAKSSENLSDDIVSVPFAIALIRKVEMYQWEEIKRTKTENLGGGKSRKYTEYIYKNVWSKELINSDNFKHKNLHENPQEFPIKSMRLNAKNVYLGAFKLNDNEINKLNNASKLMSLPYNEKYRIYNGFYFTGMDFDSPSIGDIKISYHIISTNAPVSVIAMQNNNMLVSYKNKNKSIDIVHEGIKTSEEMINDFINKNMLKTNLLRFAGFAMILFALKLFTAPIIEIANFYLLLGRIIDHITGAARLILAIGISGFTISLAWITYRPEIAIPTLAISLFLVFFFPKRKRLTID